MLEFCVRETEQAGAKSHGKCQTLKVSGQLSEGKGELSRCHKTIRKTQEAGNARFFLGVSCTRAGRFHGSPPKQFSVSRTRSCAQYAYFKDGKRCERLIPARCEIHCTYDPATRGGDSPDGRKSGHAPLVFSRTLDPAVVRLYDSCL